MMETDVLTNDLPDTMSRTWPSYDANIDDKWDELIPRERLAASRNPNLFKVRVQVHCQTHRFLGMPVLYSVGLAAIQHNEARVWGDSRYHQCKQRFPYFLAVSNHKFYPQKGWCGCDLYQIQLQVIYKSWTMYSKQ